MDPAGGGLLLEGFWRLVSPAGVAAWSLEGVAVVEAAWCYW